MWLCVNVLFGFIMPSSNEHSENCKAFLASRKCGAPLLEAYSLLVVIELAAKDFLFRHETSKKWREGHSIGQLLSEMVPLLPGKQALDSHGQQLITVLAKINCTGTNGQPQKIESYPGLRYLRFDCDFGTKHKESKHLKKIIAIANDIIKELDLTK